MYGKTKAMPRVVVLPRRRRNDVGYMLIAGSESFGPFKSEAQAALFATVRWPKDEPAWHIERRSEKR